MELFSGKSNLHSISITPTGMRPAYPVSVDCFQFYDLQILCEVYVSFVQCFLQSQILLFQFFIFCLQLCNLILQGLYLLIHSAIKDSPSFVDHPGLSLQCQIHFPSDFCVLIKESSRQSCHLHQLRYADPLLFCSSRSYTQSGCKVSVSDIQVLSIW